jgi:hypothetical protein
MAKEKSRRPAARASDSFDNSVTIHGSGFQAGVAVTFGGDDATIIGTPTATDIVCTPPAHAPGAVDVVVTNPDDQFDTSEGGYTYDAPPAISSITPNHGPSS